MEWITNSKLFKGSKNQEKILAAVSNPINKPLVEQLVSYVDPEYAKKLSDEAEQAQDDFEAIEEVSDEEAGEESPSGGSGPSFRSSAPRHSSPAPSGGSDMGEMPEMPEPGEVPEGAPEPETEPEPTPESATKVNGNPITSSTYVSVEAVSQAVNEIPGMLNLREDTAGVMYASLKGSPDNEIWVYYEPEVDISKALDQINLALIEAGYYFLEFNRVVRDKSAVVFNINWVSNYFNPIQLRNSEDAQ